MSTARSLDQGENFVIFSQQIHIIFALEINFLSPNVPIKCDLDILINICLGRKFENSYLKIQRRVGKFFNQLTPFVSEAISEELQSARVFLFFFLSRTRIHFKYDFFQLSNDRFLEWMEREIIKVEIGLEAKRKTFNFEECINSSK